MCVRTQSIFAFLDLGRLFLLDARTGAKGSATWTLATMRFTQDKGTWREVARRDYLRFGACDSFVAVDDHVTICLAFGRHHHDGRLLPAVGQRRQQPPL